MSKHFLLLLLGLFSGAQTQEVPIITCSVFQSHCLFEGVHVTAENPEFQVEVADFEVIKSVAFKDSSIQHLSSELCRTFPNLESLALNGLKIELIEDDAFEACLKLVSLDLNDNTIEALPEHAFDHSKQLRNLYLSNNRIERLSEQQFVHNSRLQFLHLDNNRLVAFPASALATASELLGLSLASNDLFDLDERSLVRLLPSLSYIELSNNNLACVRLQAMREAFKGASIKVLKYATERERFHRVRKVDDITCLEDKVWSSVFYRNWRLNPSPEDPEIPEPEELLEEELQKVEKLISKIKL